MIFPYMYTMYKNEIRVISTSITSHIYYFFGSKNTQNSIFQLF